jgi:NhaA family Na+:H+ antiporter
VRRPRLSSVRPIIEFLRTETGGGLVLLAATALALAWANSPWGDTYEATWGTVVGPRDAALGLRGDLRHWINEGAMVLFFFVVGLEISRESQAGELRDRRSAALPVIAAVGGMAVPALMYFALNASTPAARGWAIPMATDIAFAVGVLALLRRRTPETLHVFLLSLAIVDDIGAIVVIAAVYTSVVATLWVGVAIAAFAAFWVLTQRTRLGWIVLFPVALAGWYVTLRSGIHPTIAGVALGILAPVRGHASFDDLERRLHPYSSYLVVPLFALANAGVALDIPALRDAVGSRIFWGVVAGLAIGKLVGIGAPSALARRAGLARFPSGVGLRHVVGAGALGGIGFTVALFITTLAFGETSTAQTAKAGVLIGSVLSALIGVAILAPRTQSGSKSMRGRPRST